MHLKMLLEIKANLNSQYNGNHFVILRILQTILNRSINNPDTIITMVSQLINTSSSIYKTYIMKKKKN